MGSVGTVSICTSFMYSFTKFESQIFTDVVIPKETDYTRSKETENKMPAAATNSSGYMIALSVVMAVACLLFIWIVLFNIFTIRQDHYLQPPEYG